MHLVVEVLLDVVGERGGVGALGPHERCATVGQHAHHLGAVLDVVPAGGQPAALRDLHVEGASQPDDRRQVAGEPVEGAVEAGQVGPQHRPGVPGRVGGDEHHVHLRAVRGVETGQRRGDAGHHHLADVGTVRVAEEHQRERLRRVGAQAVAPAGGAVETHVGHPVRRRQHDAVQAVVVVIGDVRDRRLVLGPAAAAGQRQQRQDGQQGRGRGPPARHAGRLRRGPG